MDNMKISEILTNPNPGIDRTTQSRDDTFKFMLVSNIADQELLIVLPYSLEYGDITIEDLEKRFPKRKISGI